MGKTSRWVIIAILRLLELKTAKQSKAVPLHAMLALGERGYIAPAHS
jgi:hypothetical protein